MDSIIYKNLDDRYTTFEKNSPTKFTHRCIDNSITGCNKCVGYCEYRGHPGFLTRNLIRQYDCINKYMAFYITLTNECVFSKALQRFMRNSK